MKSIFFLALLTVVSRTALAFDPELNHYWESFKSYFEKSYGAKEDSYRRLIWEKHLSDVVRHNLKADLGEHSYKCKMHKYSDLSKEEYMKTLNGFKRFKGDSNYASNATTWIPLMNVRLPDKVDWREEGYVTEIKDQKDCGSCWAFSATGSLEGQNFKKTKKLISLSEQNLVDCSQKEGNEGCDGGWMDQAFEYVKHNKGIDTEKAYPYKGQDDKCHFKKRDVGGICTGYVDLPTGDEEALKQAVATIGPVSVAINAGGDFQSYATGIYDEPECLGKLENLSHGVLVVGYGTENGKDYWIVKNSWGKSWGDKGFIKMSRNKNNQCGIATKASYPLV